MSAKPLVWAVDLQRDFMLPGGALYVPGAEKRLPNIKRLVDFARTGGALVVSSACQHTPDDPEFKVFPPHCVRGSKGAELVPEAVAGKILVIPSDRSFQLPKDLGAYHQLLLEKQVLDVFSNPNTAKLVQQFAAETEFFVFGVVTEYCVQYAVKGLLERGRPVAVISDAIETLKQDEGEKTIAALSSSGARIIETDQALSEIA